jgi:hypothetical protein
MYLHRTIADGHYQLWRHDLVTTTRKATPDEIEIDRGTRGRVAVVGWL